MAVVENVPHLTEAEYLELERHAEFKSEFFEGEIFAMARGTPAHSRIAANVIAELTNRLKPTDCVVYISDLRVKAEATGLFTYPDVSVVCGAQRFLNPEKDTLLNPTVLVEVLSDSTEAYDRGKKFEHYRQIPSCREVLLVSQREPRIEQFIRQENGEWLLKEAVGVDAKVELPSLRIVLPLAEVFAKLEFTRAPLRART